MILLKVKALHSFIEKSVGLIGQKNIYPIYFTTRFGIHTFGMKSPIDVLILDSNKQVVKMIHSLPASRLFFWPPQYKDVLELPPGTIKEKGIKISEKVALDYSH
ncbi:MAG: DUF192 domain-containing protein [Candidatus Gottesmanbacteria bacterium]